MSAIRMTVEAANDGRPANPVIGSGAKAVPVADMTLVNGDDAAPGYGAYRQETTTDDLIKAARDRQKQNAGAAPAVAGGAPVVAAPAPTVAEEAAPPPQSNVHGAEAPGGEVAGGEAPGGDNTWAHKVAALAGPLFGFQLPGGGEAGLKIYKDAGVGVIEAPAQIAGGASAGAGNALSALVDFSEWLDQFAEIDMLGNPIEWEEDPARVALRNAARNDMRALGESMQGVGGEPKSATGGAVRGVSQFLVGFLPAFRLMRAAGAGTVVAGGGAGAVSDFLTQAGDDATIAELVQSVPELANPVTAFLASAPGDNEAVARLKNAAEGIVPGALLDGLTKALQLTKAARIAKAQEGAAALPSEIEAPALDQGRDFLLLGDPNGPLIEVRPNVADNATAAQNRLAEAATATETGVPDAVTARAVVGLSENIAPAPIAKGEARYVARGEQRFVAREGGEDALGQITPEISAAITREGGPIRLAEGVQDPATGKGFGEKHIEARHGAEIRAYGYEDGAALAADVATNFARVYDAGNGRLFLVKPNGGSKVAVVELKPVPGGADGFDAHWEIETAAIYRPDFFDNKKQLWQRPGPDSSAAGGGTPFNPGDQSRASIGRDEVYINFAKIDTADDVKAALKGMADTFKDDIDVARRGVRSNEATKEAADALGMSVEDVLARRQGQGFNAEEALAARRLLTASGEKLLAAARKAAMPGAAASDQFVFRKMMATHYAIQAEVIGARTETARALQAWSIPAGGGREQMKALEQMLAGSGGVDVSAAMAKRLAILAETGADPATINQVIRKGAFARTMDAVKEVWINGLLSSPTTHIVNTTSNFGVALQQIGERYVAGKIAKATGSGGVADGEAGAMMFGLLMGLKDAFRTAGKALLTGDAQLGFGKMEAAREPAVSAAAFNLDQAGGPGRVVDLLGHVARVPGRVLETQDAFFKSIGYRMELQAQAFRQASAEGLEGNALGQRVAQLVNDPPENIRLAAADAALYNTFTNETGEFGKKILSLRNGGGALNPIPFIMPFVRTPINIARYSFERTPLAPLVGQWRADIAAGGARRDIALARMATGSAAMALASDMAMQGVVTGKGPSDPGERQALLRTGWQPYSVKVGDKWISYARTDPFGMTLGAAADFTEALSRGDVDPEDVDEWNEVMAGMIAAVSQFTINKTYLSGLSDFVNVMTDPERFGPGYVDQFAASFLPFTSAMGAAERAADPTVRNANSPMEAMLAKIPGLSDRLTPRRDLWGQPIKPDEVYGRAYDVLAPAKVTKIKESPIDAEMLKQRVFVAPIKKKTSFAGVEVNLKNWPEVYDAYVELAGNGLKHPAWNMGAKDFLDAVVSGKSEMAQVYQVMSDGADGTKGDFIKDTIRDYRELAQQQILADPKFAAFARFIAEQQSAKQQRQMPGPGSGSGKAQSLPALQ